MTVERNMSIRCTTSTCALPMINSERLDRDWYEGIVQKLRWNVPIRAETSEGPPPIAPSRQAQRKEEEEESEAEGENAKPHSQAKDPRADFVGDNTQT